MKVNGKTLTGPRIVKTYLPTSDGGAVEFQFRPLRADEKYTDICPRPNPPEVIQPGGIRSANPEDAGYKIALKAWSDRKWDWEFLKSVSQTTGLEWETVDPEKAETWGNWENEVNEHFGPSAAAHLTNCFVDAQFITEDGIERARASFLTGTLGLNG